MANREPLQPGTTIKYRGAVATVISDNGGDTIVVECEGLRQTWEWECEGLKCRVIKKPRQERATADKPAWLKGHSDVEWSYNVIAEWLSSGIMQTVAKPGDAVLAELQKLIYAALTTARQAAVQDAYTWRHLDKLKPPDDTVCLVTDEGLQPCVARYIASADYFVGQFRGYNPRWWLPIPMSPAVEAGKEGKE